MASKVLSAAVIGLGCEKIEVEADTSQSLPGIFIVGLPDKAVDESKERVRSAIKNSRLETPRTKVTINLAPADLKKEGPSYDLPIAVSILVATGQLKLSARSNKSLFVGELALDGSLRAVSGVLSICLAAKAWDMDCVFLPRDNADEAALVEGITVYSCATLRELIDHLSGKTLLERVPHRQIVVDEHQPSDLDMMHIRGQEAVKRALEIAAAGGHNILMSGPPGSGKTLLAKTMTTILPPMTSAEALEVTAIYSVAGLLSTGASLISVRPFRSPHHTASGVALVGGGAWPRPGEISLAHRGVLFLDEFPEFQRSVLENLRQPLEDGVVSVSRAAGTIHFPAQFILVAAMNPCPCGYLTDPDRQCICSPGQIIKYQKRISGPLLDRIDVHIAAPKVHLDKLTGSFHAEPSATIRARVEAARQRQYARLSGHRLFTNSEMSSRLTKQYCPLDEESTALLRQAASRLNLSARSYFRILKLSRTIADLAGEAQIGVRHVSEALQYRPRGE